MRGLPSIPTDHQTVDGKVPAIPHYVQNCVTTNLVGGWIWILLKINNICLEIASIFLELANQDAD